MSRRMIVGVIVFALTYMLGGSCAQAQTTARAAAIVELKSGRVLYAHNEKESLPMASTTKVMTALLALENGKPDDRVVTGDAAFGVAGTSIYLSRGETLRLEEMLYGLMLSSGNDAAVAIAEHIGITVEGFAQMMNQRAQEIGATGTHFVTPHGLPCQDHYTTALDLALICREAMQNDAFREIVSTQRASIPWEGREYYRVLKNKNALLSTYEGATGIKTGYTKAAGRCLAFGAVRNGMEIVGVLLNCGNWFEEAARLMDQVFEKYHWHEALADAQDCGEVLVEGGKQETVRICAQGALGAPLSEGENARVVFDVTPCVRSPLPAGTQVGWAYLKIGEETAAKTALVLSEPAEAKLSGMKRILYAWPATW